MCPILTTPATKKSNLCNPTSSIETTPLLQYNYSFYSEAPVEREAAHFLTNSTTPCTPPLFPIVLASASPRPVDGPINTNSSQVFEQNQAQRDPKSTLALESQAVSLTLENVGSVARDHLASERTFLAYVRTSISVASAGVALAQVLSFTSFNEKKRSTDVRLYARPLGGAAVLLAIVILGVGVYRYFSIQRALVKGAFPVSRVGVISLALLLGALVSATFGVLFVTRWKEW